VTGRFPFLGICFPPFLILLVTVLPTFQRGSRAGCFKHFPFADLVTHAPGCAVGHHHPKLTDLLFASVLGSIHAFLPGRPMPFPCYWACPFAPAFCSSLKLRFILSPLFNGRLVRLISTGCQVPCPFWNIWLWSQRRLF